VVALEDDLANALNFSDDGSAESRQEDCCSGSARRVLQNLLDAYAIGLLKQTRALLPFIPIDTVVQETEKV